MKSFTVAAAALAVASAPLALAKNYTNFVFHEGVHIRDADDSQYCILFDSYVDAWYYTLQPPWGSSTGQGTNFGSLCVPTSSTGGAMFVGPDANPGSGSTKIECEFPSSGTAYCDISLVDGYSQPVLCSADGETATIGGQTSLYGTGVACPDQDGVNCINQNGYAASQSDVAQFFQEGVENGNNFCIWKNCNIPNFPVANSLTCGIYNP